MISKLENTFKDSRKTLVKFEEFEEIEAVHKSVDTWVRKEGGGGKTAVIANGNFLIIVQ